MRICTSISPRRKERQQKCINSWLALGCKVIAIQSEGEASSLQQDYPRVSFIETNRVGDVFNRPKLVRIRAILDQAKNSPILILNSDIEVRPTAIPFDQIWKPTEGNNLQMGI